MNKIEEVFTVVQNQIDECLDQRKDKILSFAVGILETGSI